MTTMNNELNGLTKEWTMTTMNTMNNDDNDNEQWQQIVNSDNEEWQQWSTICYNVEIMKILL